MNKYTIIAGVNGTGKSSFRGVLEGQGEYLGHIIDPDLIAKNNNFDIFQAGKQAVSEITNCLKRNISFTQETTLSGRRIERIAAQSRKQGYYISLYYIGLNTLAESLQRIENRVRKGGHDIPKEDVERRFSNRYEDLEKTLPYCDEVSFYDNENGFVKVGEIRNNRFSFINGYRPQWLISLTKQIQSHADFDIHFE